MLYKIYRTRNSVQPSLVFIGRNKWTFDTQVKYRRKLLFVITKEKIPIGDFSSKDLSRSISVVCLFSLFDLSTVYEQIT